MSTLLAEYAESDCCGNGCANCVLDQITIKSAEFNTSDLDVTQKPNVLQNYRKFCLISKRLHLSQDSSNEIFELHFKYKDVPTNNTNKKDGNGDMSKQIGKNVYISNKNNVSNEDKCYINSENQEDIQNNGVEYLLYMKPGHHLMLRVPWTQIPVNEIIKPDDKNEYLLRPYSPFWWHKFNLEFKILVNFRLQGPMSFYLQKSVTEGDLLEFRGPIGAYEYHPDNEGKNVLVILTQGVAIAAVISIIEQILQNEDDFQSIVHFACFRHLNAICFREKLYNFSHYWNYKVHIFLSRQLCNSTVCFQNQQCSENCPDFCNQLKYREQCYPYRMTEDYLYQLLSKTIDIKKNSNLPKVNYFQKKYSVIIGGAPDFQKHYKSIFLSDKFQFNDKKVYLL